MAGSLLRSRITVFWAALVAATCLSWESAGQLGQLAWAGDPRVSGALVLAIAFVKVRWILLEFMELRDAPRPIRGVAEAWAALVCAGLIGLYWFFTPAA